MNNKLLWFLAALLLVSIELVEAQQPSKVPRIGYISGTQGPYVEALRQGAPGTRSLREQSLPPCV